MSRDPSRAQSAIEQARQAFRKKDRRATRYWAQQAVALAPELEAGWLWLAAVSGPDASVTYLKRALAINPSSQKAQRGMQWAVERQRVAATQPHRTRPSRSSRDLPGSASSSDQPILRSGPQAARKPLPQGVSRAYPVIELSIPSQQFIQLRPISRTPVPWVTALVVFFLAWVVWVGVSPISVANFVFSQKNPVQVADVVLGKATRTPTATPTDTATPTLTPTATPTDTPTSTSTPTDTPTPIFTDTPEPPPSGLVAPKESFPGLPAGVNTNEKWIDVNLTLQSAYAYHGKSLVSSFLVSTGTWQYPTVTGTFNVYLIYRYADMSGPGYYLPDVPYVMYFYESYGLHGTYWHHNFGTPMSHGCINFTIEDAGWLFNNWVTYGTVVNIHY